MRYNDIGDILHSLQLITTAQLQECREIAKSTAQTLAQCFLEKKFVSAQEIAKAYAELFSYGYVDTITEKMADPTILGKIALSFLREHAVIPVTINGVTTILTANPNQFQPIDDINVLLGGGIPVAVSTREAIIDAINRYYPLEGTKQMIEELEEEQLPEALAFEDIEEKDILAMATEAPIIKLVNHILVQAVKRGASDIHIEPYEKELRVRYRIDGIMYDALNPPKRLQGALGSRIKIMSNLNIAEKRLPQDGRIEIKVADKPYDIRVSVLPVSFGERIVMRLLDKSRTFVSLQKIGFNQRDYDIVQQTITRPNGIFFVTGPTGSGKTTTLYSILSELNSPEVNIITVEDPVEYQISGISQVQVNEKIGLTFAASLRSILRQDPDIVMIGETRDFETAQIAIQAALTGHLVLSTLHTNNAPSAITRLIDMGVEPFLIASSVVAILAQRLVRVLCEVCKQIYEPSAEELARIGLTKETAREITFYRSVGCDECNQTGYKGRMAIFEVMEMSSKIAKLTIDRVDASVIRREALKEGMTLLIEDGIRRIREGLTTIEEVVRVAVAEEEVVE